MQRSICRRATSRFKATSFVDSKTEAGVLICDPVVGIFVSPPRFAQPTRYFVRQLIMYSAVRRAGAAVSDYLNERPLSGPRRDSLNGEDWR